MRRSGDMMAVLVAMDERRRARLLVRVLSDCFAIAMAFWASESWSSRVEMVLCKDRMRSCMPRSAISVWRAAVFSEAIMSVMNPWLWVWGV